jgi:hypothetical protein
VFIGPAAGAILLKSMQRILLFQLTPVQETADPIEAVALAIAAEDLAGVFQALVRRVP